MSERAAPGSGSNAARVAAGRPHTSNRPLWAAVAAVVVVLAVVAAFFLIHGSRGSSPAASGGSDGSGSTASPASVVQTVTGLEPSVYDRVGRGSALFVPKAVGGPPLTKDGKPEVVFMGAEFCPYCAAQRWAVVAALSRFGTFTHLGRTHSATNDVYPDTQTFSFYGASYSSPYIAFRSLESQTSTGAPLQTPTAQDVKLQQTYDQQGSIPFIDYGNRFVSVGAQVNPALLQGLSMAQIAEDLRDPSSPVAQSILGSANSIAATICRLTGGKPSGVCASPGVSAFAGSAS